MFFAILFVTFFFFEIAAGTAREGEERKGETRDGKEGVGEAEGKGEGEIIAGAEVGRVGQAAAGAVEGQVTTEERRHIRD